MSPAACSASASPPRPQPEPHREVLVPTIRIRWHPTHAHGDRRTPTPTHSSRSTLCFTYSACRRPPIGQSRGGNTSESVDGTETKSTSITCVAPAPGPTERPGRVTTYNRPALGPHAQRQPTLSTIDNNALAAPRRPVEHQPASRAAPGNAPGRPPPCAPYACAWRLWPPDHTSASL